MEALDALQFLKKEVAGIAFFGDFSDAEMEHVYHNGHFKICKAGETIIREGNVDRTMFVLITGATKVTRRFEPEKILAVLKPGTIFGEIEFVSRQVRSTSVIAMEESLVFQLEEKHYSDLPPEILIKIQHQAVKLLLERLETIKRATGYDG
ncbi:MAG: cyclic nucleotide-binding domain-containing protein [Magnetococcales bacterium]|nr:cyclic nucleotide-binding domain-containing protein [Magnetococcales bacterium]